MEKLRSYAQNLPITFPAWIISFIGIVLIRTFFEQFSSYQSGHFALIDAPTLVHYGVSYLAIVLTFAVILIFFTKASLHEVLAISIFGFLIVLTPPIIDFIHGGIGGGLISYFFVPGKELFFRFITFFGWNTTYGITLGIQIEVVAVMIATFTYVYAVTRKITRAFLAAFAFYCLIFFIFSIPSFVALFINTHEPFLAITRSISSSNIIPNNMHPNFSANSLGLFSLAFNKMMIGVSIIIVMISSAFLFFLGARKKFVAVIKNSRPERILHYLLLFFLGYALAGVPWFLGWLDVQSLALALISFTCAWLFSVCQNDIYDEDIDLISNAKRPIALGELSKNEMETASKIFLFFSIVSAYASGGYILFFVALFISVYYLYSNPPLRLKRVPILGSFLIGLACLAAVLGGFFAVSPDKNILSFPVGFMIVIVILFTAVSNIRDIKDVEGDRAGGIKTLPVILGQKRAKILIAVLVCLGFLLAPWYLHSKALIIPSILASLLCWYFITGKNYKEWRIFAVYLLYLLLLIFTVSLK